ncbi:hypothetical protein [Glutamicibacter sp. NPDC087344]|uniref:hypothetical protein n=1 Tax=Glutamicibacter sp. NPDC087344 TaxID=3363994 RepID=UPI0038297D5F
MAGEKPAERARAERGSNALSDKFELRRRLRAALSTANSAEEYVRHAQDLGVRIAPSFRPGSNSEVRGYRVSLGERGSDDKTIWYAPSKLDSTLAWNDIHARYGNKDRAARDAYLVSLHSSNQSREHRKAVARPVSAEQLEWMMSHKTGPDTLANVYARLSLQWERNKPGTLHQLSMSYARATQGMGNTRYAARLNQRFAAGNGRGWVAVAKQAGRLGRVMMQNHMATDRPRFVAGVDRLINDAESIVNAEMKRIQAQDAQKVGASKQPHVPYRDWDAGAQPGPGNDQGYER